MAGQIIVAGAPLKYSECPWGDLITGTKQQLQALGLALGRAFPGELGGGGPKSKIRTRDPYGCDVVIERCSYSDMPDQFSARRTFSNLPRDPEEAPATTFAPGVRRREYTWWDEYVGTAPDLIAAGLIAHDHLSALAHLKKKTLTVYADGTVETGRMPDGRIKEAGARRIRLRPSGNLSVEIIIARNEGQARFDAGNLARRLWESQALAKKRPPRLLPMDADLAAHYEAACTAASRDVKFQGMLSRLVRGGAGDRNV